MTSVIKERRMSRTIAFGRDVLNAPDVDIEDLLACLSPSEVQTILDEIAGDPDDKHVPPSVRTSYKCDKAPTGGLDRNSLISHINNEALTTPDEDEEVTFEAGIKRGKVFIPSYNEEEMLEMQKKADIAEQVKLAPDEEEALGSASLDDIMALADILNTNPQIFLKEAYADPLKYYEPDPPNLVHPKVVLDRLTKDDKELKDVNLNNVAEARDEQTICDLFDSLRINNNLTKLSVVNCEISDFSVATLCLALENNTSLKSLNLEGNKISPDSLARLFECLADTKNGLVEVRVSGQQQERIGHRVEALIAEAIMRNSRLLKCGICFQFPDVANRVSRHLIRNVDKLRRKRKGENTEDKSLDKDNDKTSNVLEEEAQISSNIQNEEESGNLSSPEPKVDESGDEQLNNNDDGASDPSAEPNDDVSGEDSDANKWNQAEPISDIL